MSTLAILDAHRAGAPVPCLDDPHGGHDWLTDGTTAIRAALLCNPCPYRADCLATALAEEGNVAASCRGGIRGGTTPDQRAHMETP